MRTPARSVGLFPLFAIFVFIFSGCAGPLEIKYDPKTIGQFKTNESHPVFISEFTDKRENKGPDPRAIGKIENPVSDMTGSKLILSEDVTDTVERAYAKELAIAGFTVVAEKEKARYTVSGEVREFSLDIASRDTIAIAISSNFSDAKSGELIWSGTETERGDRFAGVMGNSRSTISNYIAATVQKVIRRSIASAGQKLSASPARDISTPAPAGLEKGKAVISATPERSKAYIDGVYYGLTPLTIELPPGVYELTIKSKGFKPYNEKISVREATSTEIEAELEAE